MMRALLVAVGVSLLAVPVRAEPPDILSVVAEMRTGTWTFDVTIGHPDTGWDHYADGWGAKP